MSFLYVKFFITREEKRVDGFLHALEFNPDGSPYENLDIYFRQINYPTYKARWEDLKTVKVIIGFINILIQAYIGLLDCYINLLLNVVMKVIDKKLHPLTAIYTMYHISRYI